ncbi:hypothetical protein KUCAC02_011923 [Chaenocephalus aceratus]|uniref:Uncharacterized protein n=1 Tax=Chaenocephalus aceratus TaxID=36190 RepID=A0ACB9XAT1_CHAAC|nr:hypothetical protein KUCAC02_011923 [Chaenocephalus aceratus]
MEAYTKLTDCVFDQILNSTEDNLKEAREILKNIVDRKHYRCLGEIKHKGTPTKEAQADGLTQEDFVILSATMDYGSGAEDPIDSMDFYNKNKPKPNIQNEERTGVYGKKIDPKSLEAARGTLEQLNPVWSNSHVTES